MASKCINWAHIAQKNPDSSSSSSSSTINHHITQTSTSLATFKMQFSIATLVSVLAAAEVATAWQSTSNSQPDRHRPSTDTIEQSLAISTPRPAAISSETAFSQAADHLDA